MSHNTKSMKQVKTGVSGLDSILKGGIPEGSIIELSGVPGSGKTILALQFLLNSKEPSLFVSFEQDEANLQNQAASIGSNIPPNVSVLFAQDNTLEDLITKIESEVRRTKSTRLVIDSISSLINTVMTPSLSKELSESSRMSMGQTTVLPLFIDSEPQVRAIVWSLISRLRNLGCTTLLTSELSRDSQYFSRDTISEFKVDGIVLLAPKTIGDRQEKTLQVVKMRYTDHDTDPHLLSITSSGVKVSKLYEVEEK